MAEPDPVPVRDLEVADRIARAVRSGRAADRSPTIEQLVAAFGEREPTVQARRRAARALALAGVAAVPDVLEAAPGQRLTLEVRHVRKRRALVLGVLALVLLLAAVAAAATQLDFSDDEPASSLPAGAATTAPTNTVTQEPASTATTSTATTSTATTSTGTTTTTPKPSDTAAERRRKKRIRERRARESQARARRARARAAARRRVTVRLNARLATFLCVEGDGKQLFNGTLSGARTFRGRVVRLNIGLGPSTQLTANGKAVPLTASPTGIELTPKSRRFLPLGSRPCA